MSLKKINTVLAAAGVLFVLYIGVIYAFTPETAAPGFGLPNWPSGDGGGFLIVKGGRDIASGVGLALLLMTGHRRALGWVLLGEALAPVSDMINVLGHHGSVATALGVHGLTAALVAVTGLLLLRETRETGKPREAAETAAPAPASV
jgi:hypothetical protein